MNFKRFHVSKNLFDYKTAYAQYLSGDDVVITPAQMIAEKQYFISAEVGKTITISVYAKTVTSTRVYIRANINGVTVDSNSVSSGNSGVITVTVTPTSTSDFFNLSYGAGGGYNTFNQFMLNTGSTPQPYEPYSSEVWHNTPYYIHNTSTDTITTLPTNIYVNDTTAIVGLKGSMVQTGTPTPTNPIQPQECGERTGNWFDVSNYALVQVTSTAYRYGTSLGVLPAGEYQFTRTRATDAGNIYLTVRTDNTYNYNILPVSASSYPYTITADGVSEYIIRTVEETGTTWADFGYTNMMVNSGSTSLPYEPYGYKIPILSANTTTNIYLGEVQTTRYIKKRVLTGNETVESYQYASTNGVRIINILLNVQRRGEGYCNIYPVKTVAGTSHCVWIGSGGGDSNVYFISILTDMNMSTTDEFKQYLADQYAAGTPVTVWYVLATPQTGIINEPLMKIGTYADNLTTSIPCTAGANTLSVDTTLQPSEVSVNYKGWHTVTSVKEWDAITIADLENLTILQMQTYTIAGLQGGNWV